MVQTDHRYIMSGLLEGWDWFDNGLQSLVKAGGYRPLNKSQSMMVLYISAGLSRPIDISRKMRLSRQAIRHIANQLIAMDVLTAREDPTDGRSIILEFTERSTALRALAQESIYQLEAVLLSRLGRADFETLRRILKRNWGKTIGGAKDLDEARARARKTPTVAKKAAPQKKSARCRTATAIRGRVKAQTAR